MLPLTFAIKKCAAADDTREVIRSLAVCPTCAWPILADVGACVRCRPSVSADADDPATLALEGEIARTVAGQMPTMAVFTETQQISAAEKQSELAWREAQLKVVQRRRHVPKDRFPIVVGVVVVAALIAAFLLLRGGDNVAPSLATPANDLPWRSVVIESEATVELPGEPVVSTVTSEIGRGQRIATTVPGATIAVSVYRADHGMRGAGATAGDVLKARAAELGDADAGSRITQSRARWGDAYDLSVITDETIARLRAIVAGPRLFLIEVVGSQSTRTTQIFSRVINTLAPTS